VELEKPSILLSLVKEQNQYNSRFWSSKFQVLSTKDNAIKKFKLFDDGLLQLIFNHHTVIIYSQNKWGCYALQFNAKLKFILRFSTDDQAGFNLIKLLGAYLGA